MISNDNKRIWIISTSLLIADQKGKVDICKHFYIELSSYCILISDQ